MTNVVSLSGDAPTAHTGEPNESLVAMLSDALEMAKSGRLQSFIGTGFIHSGERLALWGPDNINVYEMMGALAWLQHEYAVRDHGHSR